MVQATERNRRATWTAGAIGYVAVRVALALQYPPVRFADSPTYTLRGPHHIRPYGISMLFDVLGNDDWRVLTQTVLGALLWCWLIFEVRTTLAHWRSANRCAVFLALASLTGPVLRWDGTVLSETLALGLLAGLGAAWLRWQRLGSRQALIIGCVTIAVSALVRETVYLALAIPTGMAFAVSIARRSWSTRTQSSVSATSLRRVASPLVLATLGLGVLAMIAVRPGNVVYEEHGSSFTNFRTMNVVGRVILPDPYLRARMVAAGMPADVAADPAMHTPRFSMDDDWVLFSKPSLVAWVNDFPTASYLAAQLRRPVKLQRELQATLDSRVFRGNDGYGPGGYEVVPKRLSSILWGWPGALHIGLTFFTAALYLARRRSVSDGERIVADAAFGLTAIMAAAGALAFLLDAMERPRHVLPFWVFGRLGIVAAFVVTASAVWELDGRRLRSGGAPVRARRLLPVVVPAALAGVVGASVVVGVSRALDDRKPAKGVVVHASAASPALVERTERQLRSEGVRISPEVHRMLGLLLRPWESRDDLRAAFSTPEGTPDLVRLSGWMRTLPDASAEGFVPELGALEELRGRMGVISDDTGIAPVLYWSFRNGTDRDRDVTGLLWRLVDLWRSGPEVAAAHTFDGRVDVAGFLRFAVNLAPDDPRRALVGSDAPLLGELIVAMTPDLADANLTR